MIKCTAIGAKAICSHYSAKAEIHLASIFCRANFMLWSAIDAIEREIDKLVYELHGVMIGRLVKESHEEGGGKEAEAMTNLPTRKEEAYQMRKPDPSIPDKYH